MVDGSTPGEIFNDVSVIEPPSPVLLEIFSTSPPCGLDSIQHIENKRQSTSLGLVVQTQKLDAVVDRKLPGDIDSASIFSRVNGHKLSDKISGDLYMRCRMNLTGDPV